MAGPVENKLFESNPPSASVDDIKRSEFKSVAFDVFALKVLLVSSNGIQA